MPDTDANRELVEKAIRFALSEEVISPKWKGVAEIGLSVVQEAQRVIALSDDVLRHCDLESFGRFLKAYEAASEPTKPHLLTPLDKAAAWLRWHAYSGLTLSQAADFIESREFPLSLPCKQQALQEAMQILEAFVSEDWDHMDDRELAVEHSLGNKDVAKHIRARVFLKRHEGRHLTADLRTRRGEG